MLHNIDMIPLFLLHLARDLSIHLPGLLPINLVRILYYQSFY
jgi:hypothetical protein